MAVNPDHVHLFIKYPPKYSVSYLSKMIESRSSRVLGKEFPHLMEWYGDHLRAPNYYHGYMRAGWDVVEKYIAAHNTTSIIGDNPEKSIYAGLGHLFKGISMTARWGFVHPQDILNLHDNYY